MVTGQDMRHRYFLRLSTERHASCFALVQPEVINCNPETVSTDYDESDRLYFEDFPIAKNDEGRQVFFSCNYY